ncbi:MAG: GMC family oxidoreductase N-terminal domain-containing protein [Rhizobiales bacterium]|nr:GMC family oxidoreductase N-terminal domain-containing protein [Hyphomicrobiales bacterium]NRB13936.1 GMC family oxidoreductase N-terminal domain-containing protein [Hyphomicrobiales bacterium]
MGENWDFIIIGAGSAGCVLANRLSANFKHKILLIEAGKKDTHPLIKIPVGYLYFMANKVIDWGYNTAPDAGLNGRSLAYPRGKVLGGCSAINGMIYSRGQKQDYDEWHKLGNQGWAWDELLPLFKRGENHHRLSNEFHSQKGELPVVEQRLNWQILDHVEQAANEIDIQTTQDFNDGDNEGCGYFDVNQLSGTRFSCARAFLKPIKHRKNLTIVTEAMVHKINIVDKVAESVVYEAVGQMITAKANKEIILSAGSIGSVQIMQLSGIGDAEFLKSVGVKPMHQLAGVGQNLQDHLQIRTIFKLTGATTLNDLSKSWWGKLKIGLEYIVNKSRPISMAPSQFGIFAKSASHFDRANIEYHVQPLSLEKFGEPLHKFSAITVSVCNLRPKSRGYVNIISNVVHDAPTIKADYLSHEDDKQVAIDSIKHARKLMQTKAMSGFSPVEYKPGAAIVADADLLTTVGDISTTIFHPVGTCKMGKADDELAVVNHKLQVHGIKNLRIADGSIMPNITSGNTNAPIIMIAEKCAAMVINDHS